MSVSLGGAVVTRLTCSCTEGVQAAKAKQKKNTKEKVVMCFMKSHCDKKINLGLDLQGGSYLLLEINSDSLIQEKIQVWILS